MKKIVVIDKPHCCPAYDEKTNKLLYWWLTYKTADNVEETRYFRNTLFSRGFKKMCRFQNRLVIKQNAHTK